MGVPVILEYEDDAFSDVHGSPGSGILLKKSSSFMLNHHSRVFKKLFGEISGVMAASPYLLSQIPDDAKKILVRGVVSEEILKLSRKRPHKNNWVVFSGTHERTQGLEQTVKAWQSLKISGWELHIAGQGVFTSELKRIAGSDRSIVFHGYLNREQNAELLCSAKIGMNAQDVTRVPGNVFAFKIVEYLAAGLHVISTPRGSLENELEAGMTYIQDNSSEAIAATLKTIIDTGRYTQTAEQDAVRIYGPASVCESLNNLLTQVTSRSGKVSARLVSKPLNSLNEKNQTE
jgi:glycosyltransferase involved in cell wall biosynthesis